MNSLAITCLWFYTHVPVFHLKLYPCNKSKCNWQLLNRKRGVIMSWWEHFNFVNLLSFLFFSWEDLLHSEKAYMFLITPLFLSKLLNYCTLHAEHPCQHHHVRCGKVCHAKQFVVPWKIFMLFRHLCLKFSHVVSCHKSCTADKLKVFITCLYFYTCFGVKTPQWVGP